MSKLTMSKFTAMQELIKFMQKRSENTNLIANAAYSIAIRKATELLETERKHIVKAYTNGQKVMVDIVSERFKDAFPKISESINKVLNDEDDNEDAEQYFTQTFTQNQQP